ncbi:hypothetical protein DFJ63DRAFT_333900 [Scheffersomyces coipomensis]|uniref:uncharacterized protein n=1 Tax=Scheffersomyces coipomensis TaxID=1788519 RepID=UPI00315D7D08
MFSMKPLHSDSDDEDESCHETPSSSFSRQSPTLLQQLHTETLNKRSEQSEENYKPSKSQYPWGHFDQILLQFYNGDYQKYRQLQLFDERFEREDDNVEIIEAEEEITIPNETKKSLKDKIRRLFSPTKFVKAQDIVDPEIEALHYNSSDPIQPIGDINFDTQSIQQEQFKTTSLTQQESIRVIEKKRSISLSPAQVLQNKKSRRQRVLNAVQQQIHEDFEKQKVIKRSDINTWLYDKLFHPQVKPDAKSFDMIKLRAIRKAPWTRAAVVTTDL